MSLAMFTDLEFWIVWAMFTIGFKLWVDEKLSQEQ